LHVVSIAIAILVNHIRHREYSSFSQDYFPFLPTKFLVKQEAILERISTRQHLTDRNHKVLSDLIIF
jgi:hypothetical protein